MDLVREDMERVGAKEGDEVDRVKWKILSVATPSREKPKEEEELTLTQSVTHQNAILYKKAYVYLFIYLVSYHKTNNRYNLKKRGE